MDIDATVAFEIDDQTIWESVEGGVDYAIESAMRGIDDYIDIPNVTNEVQVLLESYEGNPNPCDTGRLFEAAVWCAMSREDAPRAAVDEQAVLALVRREIRAMLGRCWADLGLHLTDEADFIATLTGE